MKLHILIIDPDAAAAQVTCARIARLAPWATFAIEANPESAWNSAQQQTPDIVLIDPAKHRLHCPLLIQLIKETYPATGIVVLDSRPTPSSRRSLQALGVDLYLDKGASMSLLGDRLSSMLTGYVPPAVSAVAP